MMTKKIRVLQVINGAKPGGAETFFLRLVKAFHQNDLGIDMLPVVREGAWLAEQLDTAGIPYKTAAFGGFFDRSTRKKITSYIEEWQPQVIQSWMNRATRFVPDVAIPKVARLGGYYNLRYYRKMDHLVGNTQDICRYIKSKGWDGSRVHYIPNFAEEPPEDFKGLREDVRGRYGIRNRKCVVLLAGRLHENKGFDLALYALRSLPENIHFLIAGDGPQRAVLESVVEADNLQDRVTFAGWVPHISPLAAAADIWLAPSRIEPLGNIVLDAWAHKIPIIASNVVGPMSLIRDGEDGLLIPLEDDKAMIHAIEQLANDAEKRMSMAAKGYETFQEKFTPDVVMKQYVEFYEKLTESRIK
ncbi:MAG: glycosyltransferase [Alphaproteobacteria bacterium]|nr:glycosyltransferase [Alphaproteobacteria bacterium]MDD9919626.1 glycosyltransferase [Alphaproteobacteria bacterium]